MAGEILDGLQRCCLHIHCSILMKDAEVESREELSVLHVACWLIGTCGVSDTGLVSNIVFESTDDYLYLL